MWAALRSRSLPLSPSCSSFIQQWRLGLSNLNRTLCSVLTETTDIGDNKGLLDLQEVEKVLSDVKADNITVIPVKKHCDFADFMIVATGRSPWHVRNIAQALIYKAGTLIVHALDEKVRAYYNLERLWTAETSNKEQTQELEKAFVKVRRKNNSKKPVQSNG
ncbi:unnamed protein product [Ilex paraguariensis]|uniref:Protein Iojap-related, mitochondrial n=1 Tax=Ilex paraguariensis TaxID=185542 RepID=A0ABC8SXU8_9AQUA